MNKNRQLSNPLITIITVVYNAEKNLEQTIESVINQEYQFIEYIIIDGGSTDNSLNIVKKYKNNIFCYVSEPDDGIYDAMNKGIDFANGDWVYFLGAGDLLLNVVDRVAKKLKNKNYIYYGDVFRKDLSKVYGGSYSGFKLAVTNICHQAIFYPLSFLKKYKYNTNYKTLADHGLNMIAYGDKNFRLRYFPVLIGIYEGDGYSEINKMDHKFFKDKLKLIKENFPLIIYWYAFIRKRIAELVNAN